MTELEHRIRSAMLGVRAYLDAKMTSDAVTAAEAMMELAHDVGRDHPLYVDAARVASLAYAYDRNAGMAARYMHQAVAAADGQPNYPKDRRGGLHLLCARAALEGGDATEAVAELDRAIDLLTTSRESDAEARSAMLLRIALCEAMGDARGEVSRHLERLRRWLAPILSDEAASAEAKALAEHDWVSALCSAARLSIGKGRFETAVAELAEAFSSAEQHSDRMGGASPQLMGTVLGVYEDLRRQCRGEGPEVRARVETLHPLAERAERRFWRDFRAAIARAQVAEGWSDAAIAGFIERVMFQGELAPDLSRHAALHGHLEVLGRHTPNSSNLRERGPDELRHVMRGQKTLAEALSALEEAGLRDV